jgi:hypothetical protein
MLFERTLIQFCLSMWHSVLRTANSLLLFFDFGRVHLCTSFLTSVLSFFELIWAVCLILRATIFDARDISFVALRLSGERSHCVLVFPRVSFSRCRAGEWTNDKIPYHGESAYISSRDVFHSKEYSLKIPTEHCHDMVILSNDWESVSISK